MKNKTKDFDIKTDKNMKIFDNYIEKDFLMNPSI